MGFYVRKWGPGRFFDVKTRPSSDDNHAGRLAFWKAGMLGRGAACGMAMRGESREPRQLMADR